MKIKILTFAMLMVLTIVSCNRNKHDTIDKTSKIDSGKNADPDSNIRLRLDSAAADSSSVMKDSSKTK